MQNPPPPPYSPPPVDLRSHYRPQPEDVRAIAPEFQAALSQLAGADVGPELGVLQDAAQSLLDVAGAVLGVDVAPGLSGGVTPLEAAYIAAPGNRTGAGILEEQERLVDVEGTRGTKQLLVDGDYLTVGGVGHGGPGMTEVEAALDSPPPRARPVRRGRFVALDDGGP